jgi:SulP family sulfate permease
VTDVAAPVSASEPSAPAASIQSFLGIDRANAGLALLTASVTTFIAIVNSISFPTIIFTGPIAAYLPIGIGLAFVSAAVIGAVMALGSSYKGTVAYTQSQPLVILGLIVGPMAATLHARGADDQIVPTMFAAIALGSLVCGAFLLALGYFRLGNLIRYIPFPVMGGFLAGIGWLLLTAGIASMAGITLHHDNFTDLAAPGVLEKWLPAVLIGVGLRYLQTQRPHVANLPVALLATTAAFWIVAVLLGASTEQLHADNWLLSTMPAGGLWDPAQHVESLRSVAWGLFPAYTAQFATLAVISSIALLLNANAIEIATRRDVDLDQDLKYAGLGNLICSLGGGLPGYHALNASVLTCRMKAPIRFVGLLTALVGVVALFGGGHMLSYVPRLVSGALVTDIALGYLVEWLYRSWKRMGPADFAILFLVFLTVAFAGLMEAIALGTVAGIVLFVVRYSKIAVTRNVLSGATYRSNVDRAEPQPTILHEMGDQIFILRLQGFVFFGTANTLVTQVSKRLADAARPPLRYLMFEFRLVTGMDASAVASFTKLKNYAQDQGFTIALCEPTDKIAALLRRDGIDPARSPHIRVFPDLDHGLEWAENELLTWYIPGEAAAAEASFEAHLQQLYQNSTDAERFRSYCDVASYKPGEALIRQGATADDILFIESGRVAIMLELPNGQSVRLKSMGPGLVVGEVAYYLGVPRSASVIALESTVAYRLPGERLRAMQHDDPRLAIVFHEHMARTLSMKLVETNRLVGALNQ